MIVMCYPFNKIVRFILSKGNVPVISKAWLTFVIIALFQLFNLSTRLNNNEKLFDYILYALPALVFFLIIDILRVNENILLFKIIRNRWFRWITAIVLFLPIIATSKNILSNLGINDIYYLYSLVIAILYLFIYLKKPTKNKSNTIEITSP